MSGSRSCETIQVATVFAAPHDVQIGACSVEVKAITHWVRHNGLSEHVS